MLALFLKYPSPGSVKTRLAERIGDADALALYRAMVEDLLDQLVRPAEWRTAVFFHPPTLAAETAAWLGDGRLLVPQEGRDLGERMLHGFEWSHRAGYAKTIVIGADTPTVPPADIRRAFALLDGTDVVIGPSSDGGYYLIGMRRPERAPFEDIPWGGAGVLDCTLDRARRSGLDHALLAEKTDIDTAGDIVEVWRTLETGEEGACPCERSRPLLARLARKLGKERYEDR